MSLINWSVAGHFECDLQGGEKGGGGGGRKHGKRRKAVGHCMRLMKHMRCWLHISGQKKRGGREARTLMRFSILERATDCPVIAASQRGKEGKKGRGGENRGRWRTVIVYVTRTRTTPRMGGGIPYAKRERREEGRHGRSCCSRQVYSRLVDGAAIREGGKREGEGATLRESGIRRPDVS